MAHKTSTEVKQRVIGYITTAFSLVGALAWNDAVRALIDSFYPPDKSTVVAQFIYAGIISIIVVVISVYLSRLATKEEKK